MYTGTGVAYLTVLQKEPRSCILYLHAHNVYIHVCAYTMYMRLMQLHLFPRPTDCILISTNPNRILIMFHLGGSFFATESSKKIAPTYSTYMPKGNF